MKTHIQIMAAFAVILILIPCIVFFTDKSGQAKPAAAQSETVKILLTDENKVEELSLDDYIIGSVFAQMPAELDEEALKCQAVLARTYAYRRRLNEQASPTAELNGADLSNDETSYLAYFTKEQAKELYGDKYDEAYKKISSAVSATKGMVLTYDGEPITVAFHAVSSGMTESAENAWGENIPYLITCDSSWDKKSQACERTTELTASELAARINSAYPDLQLKSGDEGNWIEPEDRTEAGTVISVRVGESFYIGGTQLAALLSLPSACFDVDFDGEKFVFTTLGCGHLVGMSQYGADCMAQQGSTYKEILLHYFPNTRLADMK